MQDQTLVEIAYSFLCKKGEKHNDKLNKRQMTRIEISNNREEE